MSEASRRRLRMADLGTAPVRDNPTIRPCLRGGQPCATLWRSQVRAWQPRVGSVSADADPIWLAFLGAALPASRSGDTYLGTTLPYLKSPGFTRTVAEIVLVAGLALLLRTVNLLRLPIFVDESCYLNWALDIWDQRTMAALWIPIVDDGKQPLYMWMAGAASYLFSDPLLAGRVVNALAGVASAVGMYLAGYWLVGRQVGLLSGLLYALVPFNLFYDRTALTESLLNTGGIWTFAFSTFIAGRASSARSAALSGAGLGIALGVALWTKMTAAFMLPFPVLCALLLARRGKLTVSARGFAVGIAVFAALAGLLLVAPDATNILDKSRIFSMSPEVLLTFPLRLWGANVSRYSSWIEAFLPAPLWWLLLPAVVWGILRVTRLGLLLLGCWATFTAPIVLSAVTQTFESRYVSQGIFLLLLLLALPIGAVLQALQTAVRYRLAGVGVGRPAPQLIGTALILALLGSSLSFDLKLLTTPEFAPLPASDHSLYVTGWTAGYGFVDAVQLVKQRATALTRDGQPIIVLGDYTRGATHAGLKVYMRRMPNVFFYVDSHLARDPEGFMAAWKPHRVPILIVGNEGYDHLDEFEKAVPQAKRLGFFPKPGGESSFRVYEVDVADFGP